METKIKEKLNYLKSTREEIFGWVHDAQNIDSDRVIRWADELADIEIKISVLEELLES